jgi:hypothetical protein
MKRRQAEQATAATSPETPVARIGAQASEREPRIIRGTPVVGDAPEDDPYRAHVVRHAKPDGKVDAATSPETPAVKRKW